jgi:hypothetical protein
MILKTGWVKIDSPKTLVNGPSWPAGQQAMPHARFILLLPLCGMNKWFIGQITKLVNRQ